MNIPTLKELNEKGIEPEILFWVGCAGSFDDRAKKITKSFVRLLNKAEVSFGVLGVEESCTGDPAKRAGNEFLFQMQAVSNIEVLNSYNIKKIVTTCPHCFNTIKNEYPSLGGSYDVVHHTQLLDQLIKDGRIKVEKDLYKGKKITFHDPCYLGRHNNEYDAPRNVLQSVLKEGKIKEMEQSKSESFCCGAGGGNMWYEIKTGDRINQNRVGQAVDTNAKTIAAACNFCNIMLEDGVKTTGNEENIKVIDIAEMVSKSLG